EVVHPIKTDKTGSFLSHDLSHHVSKIHKRDLSSNHNHSVYYKIHHNGEDLYFNLSINYNLLAPGFVTERHQGGIARAKIQIYRHNSCHFFGEVLNYTSTTGSAAISTCNGLKGVFRLSNEDYFIEPLKGPQEKDGAAQPHMIYKRHISQNRKQSNIARTCGLKETLKSEKQRERWEQKQRRKRRIKQRSISKEKWVETLVVADTKMVKYHGNDNIENYVLTVMNMVAGLFHDASIGNSINIVVVRLILLEEEEENLKITHHADNSLASFCKWQKSINVKGDSHPTHHDVAVLLTRKDICAAMNRPCETLGLSHVSGMCQPHRSCNINEDTGLPLAFTVAHELGHSFGIQHDGSGNDCEPVGKRPFIMSPQLLYDTSPLTWSRCSREYITRFLDRGWGLCLDDPPAKEVIEFPLVPPGVLYNVNHQCRLQYGAESSFCDDMDNVCNTLWCTVGSTCHSKLDAAVDGTKCGERKWCFNGECVPVGYRPDRVNGGWGSWSSWSACTRTCGAGVQKAERQCDNPRPKYGGKFCLGERTRFRICDIKPCPSDKLTFRHIQCSQFDTMPYKGKLYEWVPVPSTINPCELHCRPLEEYFSEKLLDAVIDGTPCYEGTTIRDICINGICKNVGCDYEIDSNAVEDRCGVCQGDSSTCETVKRTFEESEGLGYVDIGIIPPGAREIRIEEVAEAGNFLALRSEDPEKYFLNGGWTIQWNGDYKVAGTTFTYERTGNWENLTSPGPTKEPVWIQLLFQETNPGVRYQYTVRRDFDNENEIQPPDFSWRYGSWTKCTATCGRGVQRQIVHCVEKIVGIVEERYCDYLTRPDDKQRSCSEEPCPARWWIGEWQECSATCGDTGFMKRTVLCIQSVGLDEQRALNNSDCQHVHKPESISPCNGNSLCPTEWSVGDWSECSVTCGEGIQRRLVYCGNNSTKTCDTTQKPISKALCYLQKCPSKITDNFITEWSGSGASSKEIFNEINYISNNQNPNFSPEAKNKKNSEEDYNINNVIEEEISITNHRKDTESSSKNNVFVDDFYYDYNFINFHEDLSYYPDEQPIRDIKATEVTPTLYYNAEVEEEEEEREPSFYENNQFLPLHNATDKHFEKTQPNYLPPSNHTADNKQQGGQVANTVSKEEIQLEISSTSIPSVLSPTLSAVHSTVHYTATKQTYNQIKGDYISNQNTLQITEDPSRVNLNSEDENLRWKEVNDDTADTRIPFLSYSNVANDHIEITSEVITEPLHISSSTIPPDYLYRTAILKNSFSQTSTSEGDIYHNTYLTSTPAFSYQSDLGPTTGILDKPVSLEPLQQTTEIDSNEIKVPYKMMKFNPHDKPHEVPHTTEKIENKNINKTKNISESSPSSVPPNVAPSKPVPVISKEVYWEVGRWSECSTTCGLGAIWRMVQCSTGSDADCDITKKPAPARRCYLRPCSKWSVGNWSKCSKNCGGGVKVREVQCIDTRDYRLLRPFHCRAALLKPPVQISCNSKSCMGWYISSWSECTEMCGGGEQERLVTCPEFGRCDDELRPNSTKACNSHPCTKWVVGSWGQCSATCGGGIQRRLVKCINTKTNQAEEDTSLCDHEPWPENTQKCNTQECDIVKPSKC
uniref:ADAM metallopeptidase with thrombospondin type 1 motif 7 n=1 Tax=Latimeria chalumnae TaxID=7897 RepID=H3B1V3_LATCH